MLNLILAIQGALIGFLGSAGTDGSCPLPNSTNFNISGWNVTVSVGVGEGNETELGNTEQGCRVFIDLNLQGGCMKHEDIANLTAQDLHPRVSGNATAEVWVDDQQVPFTGAQDLTDEASQQSDRFCGDSITIHLEKELARLSLTQKNDEVTRRQATAPIVLRSVDKRPFPRLCPCKTEAPTRHRFTRPPTIRHFTPPPTIIRWPNPWPQQPDPGPVWQDSSLPELQDDQSGRRQIIAPVDQIPIDPIPFPRLCPCPRAPTPAPTFHKVPWPPRTAPPTIHWNWSPTPRWPRPNPWPQQPDPGPVWQEQQGPFGRG